MSPEYFNASGHPLDVGGGRMLAPDQTAADLDLADEHVQVLIAEGGLAESPAPPGRQQAPRRTEES